MKDMSRVRRTYAELQIQDKESVVLSGHLFCSQQRVMEEGPLLGPWDVAVIIITEGNLGSEVEGGGESHVEAGF